MHRRRILQALAGAAMMPALPAHGAVAAPGGSAAPIRLFLAGDVMTGRGIDQILPHRGDPQLYEPYVRNARQYVELAEAENGAIEAPVVFAYPWGDALEVLERAAPHARIVNLETAVTESDRHWQGKGIHYRMHPRNMPCLSAAGIDCAVLANNHVLDWGYGGLRETLASLDQAGITTAGAGHDLAAAAAPAVLPAPDGQRVLVFAYGCQSSGIPGDWAAAASVAGVNLLPDLSGDSLARVVETVIGYRRSGDRIVVSLHWGGNWGYEIPARQRAFAQGLIERAGADVVHGHSSHHPKGIELHAGRPILYGCGDLLNDYEGIGGHERFRPGLALLYFVTLPAAPAQPVALEMVPLRIERLRLQRASGAEAEWLAATLDEHSRPFGTRVRLQDSGRLAVAAAP